MSMASLSALGRSGTGKGGARKLRGAGRVPAVLYGHGQQPMSISIDPVELTTLLRVSDRGRNTVFTLNIQGVGARTVMLKEVQSHPLSRQFLHVDLLNLDMNLPVTVNVPVKFEGKAEGVKEGGLLEPLIHFLRVRCLPGDMPRSIAIDTTPLKRGETLHIKDVPMPSGVTAVFRQNFGVASVN